MARSIFKEEQPIEAPKKSKFDLSHEKKLSLEMGMLVPILTQEVLPGDSFKLTSEIMLRFAPMLAPLFHRLDVYTHFFFVPNRLVWTEWETFITGGQDGLQAPVHPGFDLLNATAFQDGSLFDYMGLPTYSTTPFTASQVINTLPFRAYQEIYNEYYRDEDLVAKVDYSKASGVINYLDPDYAKLFALRRRAWDKDYFNTARPFAQRGTAAAAPVAYTQGQPTVVKNATANTNQASQAGFTSTATANVRGTTAGVDSRFETPASVLISELRKANALQQFYEVAARGGYRFTEWLKHVFGVNSSDARLQRPEFLGGGKTPVAISEVLSTYQTAGNTPQGNMSGHGIAVGETHGFERYFEEHGFIIGIMSVMPKPDYYQGIERMWSRPTRFDYYLPQFAHLGEQEVKNKEIWADKTGGANEGTFGYQSRYAEYKFKNSTIHGQFRNSLSYWHMAQKYTALPGLNQTFIECNPRKDIFPVIAATDNPLYACIYHDMSAVRPLPYFSNPRL